ncbi:MAG: hypothetical protein K8U03_06770 [Planctomycetia bacterium]|nr:hypothetical protein [Planctomycetia bacterium]
MNKLLYDYDLNATTWVYLASLLSIAIFFKFNRFWSVRNLDLIGLISYAPGLLLIARKEPELQQLGYVWLFVVGGLFLIRILLDPTMVRRPLLETNLSPGGMTFLGISLFVFLMVNVLIYTPTERDLAAARQVDRALALNDDEPADPSQAAASEAADVTVRNRPGFFLMMWLPSVSTSAIMDANATTASDVNSTPKVSRQTKQIAASRTTAILSHMAVVVGLVLIGVRHFDNVRTGISAATLYLLLPYTAQLTGHVDHVLPAALLVWAILAYHDPLIAGVLIGLASGVIYYPLFLLPLWCGFYWRKGMFRFLGGFTISWAVLIGIMAFLLQDTHAFLDSLKELFGWTNLIGAKTETGFWSFSDASAPYRIPVMFAFLVLSAGFALWPAQKNLGTLISCSAAVMLATQFWHLDGGGAYMAWYLPLLLLTVFRPNLEDRVATSALNEGWFSKRRWQLRTRAA